MANAPLIHLAQHRANSRSMVAKKRILLKDGQDIDITHGYPKKEGSADEYGMIVFFEQDTEKAASELAGQAVKDPVSYDAALYLAAKVIRERGKVPTALSKFVSDHLIGVASRPTPNGRYPNACLVRDILIIQLINDVMQVTGLKATSGQRSFGRSACNAVAEGIGILKLQPDNYETIIKIWGKRKKLPVWSTDQVV